MDRFPILRILCLLLAVLGLIINVNGDENTFNVMDYGAVGDAYANDTWAFIKAWNDTCNAEAGGTMLIPEEKIYLVHQISFIGPCKSSNVNIKVSGRVMAPWGPNEWISDDFSTWFYFNDITGLNIYGSGSIDGRGKGWWDVICRYHPGEGCQKLAPTEFRFTKCNNVTVSNVSFIDSPQTHIALLGGNGFDFGYVTIQSPGDSPNTDGIHLHASTNVFIHDANISAGDDCISIGDVTSAVNITNINCGPGHGISIGSLGKGGSEVLVENINVSHVNFNNTTNGARIKTYQVGRGEVKNVAFSNLNFVEVENPIVIDQYYECHFGKCEKSEVGVNVSHVHYSQLLGTSKTNVAINFNCSDNVPCTDIKLDSIQLTSAVQGQEVISHCNNAHGVATGTVEPKSCLAQGRLTNIGF